jgi:hypothetical protein
MIGNLLNRLASCDVNEWQLKLYGSITPPPPLFFFLQKLQWTCFMIWEKTLCLGKFKSQNVNKEMFLFAEGRSPLRTTGLEKLKFTWWLSDIVQKQVYDVKMVWHREKTERKILDAQVKVLRTPWHQQNCRLHQDEHGLTLNSTLIPPQLYRQIMSTPPQTAVFFKIPIFILNFQSIYFPLSIAVYLT